MPSNANTTLPQPDNKSPQKQTAFGGNQNQGTMSFGAPSRK